MAHHPVVRISPTYVPSRPYLGCGPSSFLAYLQCGLQSTICSLACYIERRPPNRLTLPEARFGEITTIQWGLPPHQLLLLYYLGTHIVSTPLCRPNWDRSQNCQRVPSLRDVGHLALVT